MSEERVRRSRLQGWSSRFPSEGGTIHSVWWGQERVVTTPLTTVVLSGERVPPTFPFYSLALSHGPYVDRGVFRVNLSKINKMGYRLCIHRCPRGRF